MPHPVPSPVWSLLHRTILNIPPRRLPLFPLLSGTVWFLTLTSLLLRWITRGRKPYPGQINSSVPFISDIASFELKPLFLVGASITGGGFFVTVVAVHVVAFEPGFALMTTSHGTLNDEERDEDEDEDGDEDEDEDERNSKTLHIISLVSICAAGLASLSLILLAVMDTFRYSIAHGILLRLCFAGLAVQALGTAVVYADDVGGFRVWSWCRWTSRRRGESEPENENEDEDRNGNGRNIRRTSKRVRIFETLSTLLLLVEIFLATAFLSLSISDEVDTKYRIAAILEWVIAYLGTVYLWLFVGFFESVRFERLVPRSFARGFRGAESGGGDSTNRADGERGGEGDAERAPLLREAGLDRKYT
ncbi:Frag1/DRAM/Sfk1 family-domain-containing protein [Aspergillus stella-maris]|uniref:Frag1/DRAM/Sfk1 family-domain-containing protein n=1 Tax=Aspergillus stella-maris TaxID=1810926 RepID=UPI003CCCAF55